MIYRVYRPGPPLARFVDYLWHLSDAPRHSRERIVPAGTLELVINLQEDEIRVHDPDPRQGCRRYPGAVVSGAYSTFFVIDTREHARVMGVHFKPAGAAAFVRRLPTHELGDAHVDLHSIWGPRARELRERVCEATTVEGRFRVLERALVDELSIPTQRRIVVEAAISALRAPDASVAQLARHFGLSHRLLIEVFRAQVGTTPKLFQRMQRFQRALALTTAGRETDWAGVALRVGYCDQSHLIRDFWAFAGMSPRQYAQESSTAVKEHHVPISTTP